MHQEVFLLNALSVFWDARLNFAVVSLRSEGHNLVIAMTTKAFRQLSMMVGDVGASISHSQHVKFIISLYFPLNRVHCTSKCMT